MRRARITGLAAWIIVLAMACPAGADINYSFDLGDLVVDLEAPVSVRAYLSFTGSDLDRLNGLTAWNGLTSAGMRFQWVEPVPSQPARIAGPGDILPDTLDFDMLASAPDPAKPIIDWVNDGDAGFWVFQDLHESGVMATLLDPSEGRVYLGTFTITASLVPNETTTFIATDFDLDTDNTVTIAGSDDPLNPGVVLDSDIGQAVLRITSIPEPTGVLSAIVLAGCCIRGFLRRRRP